MIFKSRHGDRLGFVNICNEIKQKEAQLVLFRFLTNALFERQLHSCPCQQHNRINNRFPWQSGSRPSADSTHTMVPTGARPQRLTAPLTRLAAMCTADIWCRQQEAS